MCYRARSGDRYLRKRSQETTLSRVTQNLEISKIKFLLSSILVCARLIVACSIFKARLFNVSNISSVSLSSGVAIHYEFIVLKITSNLKGIISSICTAIKQIDFSTYMN